MQTFETIIQDSGRRIANLAGQLLTQDLTARLATGTPDVPIKSKHRAQKRRAKDTANVWVADARARRVPTWVIQMTGGLATKKKIVARFGADAKFENGKPLPPVVSAAAARKTLKHAAPAPVPATTQRQAAA